MNANAEKVYDYLLENIKEAKIEKYHEGLSTQLGYDKWIFDKEDKRIIVECVSGTNCSYSSLWIYKSVWRKPLLKKSLKRYWELVNTTYHNEGSPLRDSDFELQVVKLLRKELKAREDKKLEDAMMVI